MSDILKITKWLKKTQGRDKLCKILQYISRFLAQHFRVKDEYKHLMFESLFQSVRQARKLFRMFKSIDEYQSILHLIFYGQEEILTIFYVFAKFLYFLYWIFDNLSVAAKIKILQLDWKKIHRIGVKIRFAALTVSILTFIYEIQFKKLDEKSRKNSILKAAKNIFDLLPAGKDSGLFGDVFGEKLTSIGGLTSALISTYQTYEQD